MSLVGRSWIMGSGQFTQFERGDSVPNSKGIRYTVPPLPPSAALTRNSLDQTSCHSNQVRKRPEVIVNNHYDGVRFERI